MAWLTWRQHRTTGLITLALLGLFILSMIQFGLIHPIRVEVHLSICLPFTPVCLLIPQNSTTLYSISEITYQITYAFMLLAPLLAGMFVGATFMPREYERKTSILTWTQSVTRTRWFLTKIAWLALSTIVFFGLLALSYNLGDSYSLALSPWRGFSSGPVYVAIGLCGLTLGIASGAVTKRTVPAILITLVIGALVYVGAMNYVRYRIIPPVSYTLPIAQQDGRWGRNNTKDLVIQAGYIDRNGNLIPNISNYCDSNNPALTIQQNDKVYHQCIDSQGIRWGVFYQPVERYWPLQIAETAFWLALSGVFVLLSLWSINRQRA